MKIIRRAAGVIAVVKPAGLATQAPPGIPSAEAWLRQQVYGDAAGGYVGVPHRLDRCVSGVMLFAATPRAARKLSRQFERRQIRKRYLAIVVPDAEARLHVDALTRAPAAAGDAAGWEAAIDSSVGSRWHDFVLKVPNEARARISSADEPSAREAVTFVRLLRRLDGERLLLELKPLTGRMHQLRLQAATRGLHILGDTLYGWQHGEWAVPADHRRHDAADAVRGEAVALHASSIAYSDPETGETIVAEAPPPRSWPITGV